MHHNVLLITFTHRNYQETVRVLIIINESMLHRHSASLDCFQWMQRYEIKAINRIKNYSEQNAHALIQEKKMKRDKDHFLMIQIYERKTSQSVSFSILFMKKINFQLFLVNIRILVAIFVNRWHRDPRSRWMQSNAVACKHESTSGLKIIKNRLLFHLVLNSRF